MASCEPTGSSDSFQKRPTHFKNGRLWKKTADSGNSHCVWFPECMSRPRFSRVFETRSGRWGVSPTRKPGRFSRHFETRLEAWMKVGVRDADRAPRNPFFLAKGCPGVGVRDAERRRATHFSWRRGVVVCKTGARHATHFCIGQNRATTQRPGCVGVRDRRTSPATQSQSTGPVPQRTAPPTVTPARPHSSEHSFRTVPKRTPPADHTWPRPPSAPGAGPARSAP